MKYAVRTLALLILLTLLLTGCQKETPPENEAVYYTVSFDANGGNAVEPKSVLSGGQITAPEDPIRENYIFDGWYNGSEKWLFSYHSVTSDVTLKAAWKSAADVFGYATREGTDEAVLTSVKSEHATLLLPTSINGFRVVGIGDGAFAALSAEKVQKIIVPDTVVEIGEDAFAESAGIAIEIRGVLQSVGERAFFGCDGLKAVVLGDGVSRIACDAFSGSGIRSLMLPSTLTVIEEGAFQDCASLQTLVMHATLAATDAPFAVEDSAFRECDALKTVFLYGTAADKAAILEKTDSSAGLNDAFCRATFCYYSEEEPAEAGDWWYMNDGKPRMW